MITDAMFVRIVIQLVIASALGFAIGLEREHRRKAAGMRTFALVSLGAALFTIISVDGFRTLAPESTYDPSRIAANIVVGIGFLGAGLIFLQGNNVQGLTTAAALWVTAAIGMAVGMQMYSIAFVVALLTLCIMWLFRFIEAYVPRAND